MYMYICPQEGDYPGATQLCIECQKAIETYKLFSCVRYNEYACTCTYMCWYNCESVFCFSFQWIVCVTSRCATRDWGVCVCVCVCMCVCVHAHMHACATIWTKRHSLWLCMCLHLQQELEKALSKVTMKFNDHHYQQVQEAYGILGKTQVHVHVRSICFHMYNVLVSTCTTLQAYMLIRSQGTVFHVCMLACVPPSLRSKPSTCALCCILNSARVEHLETQKVWAHTSRVIDSR